MQHEQKRRRDILERLIELEQALRLLGWWSSDAPTTSQLGSEMPFCVDTLAFEQWLQFIYIPRLTDLLQRGQPLPGKSGVAEMAEEVLDLEIDTIRSVISVLRQVDELLEGSSKA